ncbi:MAG: NnrU family protein [Alphaproteobacteria bacterium]
MSHLFAAVIVFLATHIIPAAPAVRRGLVAALGVRGYVAAYSGLSLLVLAWVWVAYRAAPYIEVWPPEPWTRWVPLWLMPIACLLVAIGMATPNPFSVGPGGRGHDPRRAGVLRLTRHPVLWGIVLWAAVHMLANGDVASLILFGLMLGLAGAGMLLLDIRHPAAAIDRSWRKALAEIGLWRIGLGIVLYGGLLALHGPVFGVSPLAIIDGWGLR